jgi:hypothetical protein
MRLENLKCFYQKSGFLQHSCSIPETDHKNRCYFYATFLLFVKSPFTFLNPVTNKKARKPMMRPTINSVAIKGNA